MAARIKLPPGLVGLTRTELERAIYEAALHEDDEYIARECIVAKRDRIDVAEDLRWERKAVSRHLTKILETVEKIANRLYTERPGA